MDGLESRCLLAAPSMSVSETITVPAGKTLQVPIAGDDADGDRLSYSVSSGSGSVSAGFHANANPWLELNTSKGTMRFQLFSDVAPNTVRKIRGLVESGFYDGLTFHRAVNQTNFRIIQGGDPTGTGTGGPDFTFDDEFHKDAIFSGSGQLAMANAGKDTNGSQFFVTGGAARSLDFNHTIFGQLVRGGKTLQAILATSDPQTDRPGQTITIKSARIVSNRADAVLQVRAGKVGQTTITVTAKDADRNAVTRTIKVKVVSDTLNNTAPILGAMETIRANEGDVVTIPVKGLDLEGDEYDIGGGILSGGEGILTARTEQLTDEFVVRLKPGFTGAIKLLVGVSSPSAVNRGNIVWSPDKLDGRFPIVFDTQELTIAVGDRRVIADDAPIVAIPNVPLKDAVVATFTSENEDASKADFAASIDWGDGDVHASATIREIRDGRFAVVGSHTYERAAELPLTVEIVSNKGATAVVTATADVNEPAALSGTTLVLRGSDERDVVTLGRDGDQWSAIVNGKQYLYPLGSVKRLDVQLFGEDDEFIGASATFDATIDAGDGRDTVIAGSGNDTILGRDGNDAISGNGGNDSIVGGNGDDALHGGAGKNTLSGEAGADRLTGSGGRDSLSGGPDGDRLYGRGGDDTLDGGSGTDRLYGEDGDDVLIGGASNDRLFGGSGDDTLFGSKGADLLDGGTGRNKRGDDDASDLLVSMK